MIMAVSPPLEMKMTSLRTSDFTLPTAVRIFAINPSMG